MCDRSTVRGLGGGEEGLTYLSLLSCECGLMETHTHTRICAALETRHLSSDLSYLSLSPLLFSSSLTLYFCIHDWLFFFLFMQNYIWFHFSELNVFAFRNAQKYPTR